MHKVLVLTLLVFTLVILNPIFYLLKQTSFNNTFNHGPNLSQPENHLTVGASGLTGDWDPIISDIYNIINQYYRPNSLETVIWQPENSLERKSNLATSWEFEYWPEENNSRGFNNTGGHKSVTLTLREGVTFHDGSNWNATVLKWNIDRAHIINGNYTGLATGDYEWVEGNLYGTLLVEDYKPYWTASWNLSEYDSPNLGLTPPATLPVVKDYASYDLGPNASLVDYSGVTILPNNTVQHPNPYGGWDIATQAAIHYAPYDRFPMVKCVEILENPASGGIVKIHFNSWNSDGFEGFVNYPMISYHSYKDDYTVHGIYGYENGVLTSPNPTIVDHMIGTGPYIYVEHDETGTPPGGSMVKNLNYWNRTALEADGWFDADYVDIIQFPAGELGKDAQNTALLVHAIDYAFDSMHMPLDYNAIMANPNIQYKDSPPSEYKTNIVMNCINETWWAWPGYDAWRQSYYPLAGNKPAGGVPQAMRKAMSYSFNYDLMIGTVLNNRAVRNGGMLGVANLYYNDSIGIADYNVTKAREILLTSGSDESGEVYTGMGFAYGYWPDEDLYNYSKICAARGLTASSSDADWRYVAENNPIYTFNFYWDSAHQDVQSVLLQSLKDIGVALKDEVGTTNKVTTIIWDTVRIGHLTTFDGEYSLFSCGGWVMDEHMPHDKPQLNTFWHYVDPDRGRWRTLGGAGITSLHYWGNYGFNFNAECDLFYDRLTTASTDDKKTWFSQMADIQQNEKYGVMFLYEAKEGWALWKDWDMNLNRGPLFFANFEYFEPPLTPEEFVLSTDADFPDNNGIFNLSWTISNGADNYSLYMHDSPITVIDSSLTLLADQTAISPFSISGFLNGEYYFVVVAHNQFGDTISNGIYVMVQIAQNPPGSFLLSTDADFPDDDGIFNLGWTNANEADNNSLYMHNTPITVIDSSLTLLVDQTALSPFSISGLLDGDYYFVVVAHNQYGDTLSNNIYVTVSISTSPEISGYNTIILMGIAIITAVILFKRKKRKYKLR